MSVAALLIVGMVSLYRDNELVGVYQNVDAATRACVAKGSGSCLIRAGEGEYLVNVPDTDASFIVPERTKFSGQRIEVPQDGSAVFVCRRGSRGTSVEPEGSDENDGLSMEGAVRSLAKAAQIAKAKGTGTDLLMCEGGHWYGETLEVRWGGTKLDPVRITYYVNINGAPHWGDPSQLCGAEFGMWKEPACPEWADALPPPTINERATEAWHVVERNARHYWSIWRRYFLAQQ